MSLDIVDSVYDSVYYKKENIKLPWKEDTDWNSNAMKLLSEYNVIKVLCFSTLILEQLQRKLFQGKI